MKPLNDLQKLRGYSLLEIVKGLLFPTQKFKGVWGIMFLKHIQKNVLIPVSGSAPFLLECSLPFRRLAETAVLVLL